MSSSKHEGLSQFRLVLVGPRTPGNVGACARVALVFGNEETGLSSEELEGMMGHWEEFFRDIGLTTAGNPERMVSSLRRIFARADLGPQEVRLFRGFLSKAQVKLGVRLRGRRV